MLHFSTKHRFSFFTTTVLYILQLAFGQRAILWNVLLKAPSIEAKCHFSQKCIESNRVINCFAQYNLLHRTDMNNMKTHCTHCTFLTVNFPSTWLFYILHSQLDMSSSVLHHNFITCRAQNIELLVIITTYLKTMKGKNLPLSLWHFHTALPADTPPQETAYYLRDTSHTLCDIYFIHCV